MNDKTHGLKAVPAPDLSPLDILRFAREDCEVWLALGFEGTQTPGSKLFGAFLETVASISQAVQKGNVHEAVRRLYEVCLSTNIPPSVETNSGDETLVAEISRREEWLEEMAKAQMKVEAALEEAEAALRTASDAIRFSGNPTAKLIAEKRKVESEKDALEKFSEKLVALKGPVKAELEILRQHKRALDLVAKGYPRKMVGADMPEIPVFACEAPVRETSRDDLSTSDRHCGANPEITRVIRNEEVAAKTPTTLRRLKLREIADQHGFLEVEVFVYSLYDFLGANNALLGSIRTHRSNSRVVKTGIEMFPDFGWKNTQEVFAKSGWRKEATISQGFLKHRGNNGMYDMWVRSEKSLPWDPKSLFAEKEVASFVEQIKKPVPKPPAKG